MLKQIVLVGLVLVGLAAPVAAQTTALPGQKFVIDIVATDAATAQAYTWKLYNDGATTGVVWSGVTCVAGTPNGTQTCSGLMPAYTPGVQHSVAVTASNPAGESPKSAPIVFVLMAIPNTPINGRVQ